MYFIVSTMGVLLGVLLDLVFGDPNVTWHPICLIGNFIAKMEKGLRKYAKSEKQQLFVGGLLVCIVCLVSTGLPSLVLWVAWKVHWELFLCLEAFFAWFLLAAKSLRIESMKVYYALKYRSLEEARKKVSMIVGRDTKALSAEGVTKAAVETVAENTSDGVIAPLFFMMLGGSSLGFFYKSINTMDSMVGYKNEAYLYFGKAAAKLDDVVNFLPSRCSAWFMILASMLFKYNGKDALRIYRRDRKKHASPNAAQTESVMAGALGVQLAGDAYYFGKLYEKEYIGDALREIEVEDIKRANQIMYGTLLVGAVILFLLKTVVLICIL